MAADPPRGWIGRGRRQLVRQHALRIRRHEFGIPPEADAQLIIDEHADLIRGLLPHVDRVGDDDRVEIDALRGVERHSRHDGELKGEAKREDYQSLSPGGTSGGVWRRAFPSTSRSSRAALFSSSSAWRRPNAPAPPFGRGGGGVLDCAPFDPPPPPAPPPPPPPPFFCRSANS